MMAPTIDSEDGQSRRWKLPRRLSSTLPMAYDDQLLGETSPLKARILASTLSAFSYSEHPLPSI